MSTKFYGRPALSRRRCLVAAAAALTAALLLVASAGADADGRDRSMRYVSQLPLIGDDGQRVPNHSVTLPEPLDRMRGVVTVGNAEGKTALAEFYDLNCPFCRIASVDIGDMVDTDPELKLILVPYPVLGANSVAASRIELAVAQLGTPQQFYAFHRKVYAQHGVIDGPRALQIARDLGFDGRAIGGIADSDDTTAAMYKLRDLGNQLGLAATPAFIIDGVAILGYPGRTALQSIVTAAGTCGKVLC